MQTLHTPKEAFVKIGKGLLISMAGAGLAYLGAALDLYDLRFMDPILVTITANIVNIAKVAFSAKFGSLKNPE